MASREERFGCVGTYWLPLAGAGVVLVAICTDGWGASWDGKISQYGEMREVLGRGHHEGRIRLGDLTERLHCYAVGALAGLEGEVTVFDGETVATRVDEAGRPTANSSNPKEEKAAMLVAAYVARWDDHRIAEEVSPEALEPFLRSAAEKAGLDVSKPFPFVIEGDLVALEMHVINGACPMRAKRLGQELPPAQRPYHRRLAKTAGRLIGIYAEGAAHRLTHHGTETHVHVLLEDEAGETHTGHVEQVGIGAGAVLRLPSR
jgi:acetolactate decarboxylase